MKIAIIYYSKSGNTKQIAERIKQQAEQLNHSVHIIETKPEKQIGFLKAVYCAIRQKTLPIKNDTLNIADYDFVFVGCPVWAGKPAPFIKSMVQKTVHFDGKKTSVFITCGGGEKPESKVINLFQSYLKGKNADLVDMSLIVHMSGKGEIKKEIPSVKEYISTILNNT